MPTNVEEGDCATHIEWQGAKTCGQVHEWFSYCRERWIDDYVNHLETMRTFVVYIDMVSSLGEAIHCITNCVNNESKNLNPCLLWVVQEFLGIFMKQSGYFLLI